jgi:hypothetical protein
LGIEIGGYLWLAGLEGAPGGSLTGGGGGRDGVGTEAAGASGPYGFASGSGEGRRRRPPDPRGGGGGGGSVPAWRRAFGTLGAPTGRIGREDENRKESKEIQVLMGCWINI